MVETQAKEKLAREKDTLQTEYNELQEKLKVRTLSLFPLPLSPNPSSPSPKIPPPKILPLPLPKFLLPSVYVVTEV